eukprot:4229041-Amphidinium_carterae.2
MGFSALSESLKLTQLTTACDMQLVSFLRTLGCKAYFYGLGARCENDVCEFLRMRCIMTSPFDSDTSAFRHSDSASAADADSLGGRHRTAM